MFFLLPRTIIVLAIVFALILTKRLYRQWRRRLEGDVSAIPPIPRDMRGPGPRTWVVFTTPFCASCLPTTDRIRSADPGAKVVVVDATKRTDLARKYRIKSAPTVLMTDRSGHVRARLVGPEAVEQHLARA